MGDLTITGLDAALVSRLGERAREHGRTPEDEAREMLQFVLEAGTPRRPGESIATFARRVMAPLGGVDLEPFPRGNRREVPHFTAPEFDPSP